MLFLFKDDKFRPYRELAVVANLNLRISQRIFLEESNVKPLPSNGGKEQVPRKA
jgi:hypothetical protein